MTAYTMKKAKRELSGLLNHAVKTLTVSDAYEIAKDHLKSLIEAGAVSPEIQYELEVFLELEANTLAEIHGEKI